MAPKIRLVRTGGGTFCLSGFQAISCQHAQAPSIHVPGAAFFVTEAHAHFDQQR